MAETSVPLLEISIEDFKPSLDQIYVTGYSTANK